jgi:ParB family chromosome partitioning protein
MSAQVYDFGDALGAGFEEMLQEGRGYQMAVLQFKDIRVSEQVRQQMEDDSSTGEEMGGSIKKHGYLQTMLVRPIPGPIPYELVAGERRIVFGSRAGETEGPFLIKEMTDAEKDDIQLAENIHRKNLTQIEVAKKIQRDLDEAGGDVEVVMAKHNKGRPWISKMVGLLKLSEQAMRLLTEQVSADVEVIGMVKQIEKVNPEAAKNLVDDLAATRGKEDARAKASAVKDQVKPPKAKPQASPAPVAVPGTGSVAPSNGQTSGGFAEAKKESDGPRPVPTGLTLAKAPASGAAAGPAPQVPSQTMTPQETLDRAYGMIFENGVNPRMLVDMMDAGDRAAVEALLGKHYQAGRDAALSDVPREIMQGLRKGTFATDGTGAFAMVAFLHGSISTVQPFDLVRILSLAKA